ncbi:hypothetical protein [Nocardioides daeguensis]|uniref:Uncharacterized protein n=1 Tax=Nocardioides daeguensis TaxID=908359 RepID=A0ABP6V413_9ACTN|nr:hypothetical protein [Nocardioides daeguensis]MBV6727263.1 hypothetical protein [Nocardioides daeguensis]MCR1771277.1 hypothetical protein [Nocardioides daeguensis]
MTAEPLVLPEPALGPDRLRHDAEFRALDRTFDRIRDTVNTGIDVLNGLGLGLRRLPEGSLRELVVLPLTGDHRRIRQNAEAIGYADAALARYAGSTTRLALAVGRRWEGEAAASYLLRLGRHAAAARAAGELLALTVPVFEEVARFAERLAVEVEELVVELVERGTWLMARLLARAAGPAGWAGFAAEVAVEGLDAVTDLVDGARRLVVIVDRLLSMKGEVIDWVDQQGDHLAAMRKIADVARAELGDC